MSAFLKHGINHLSPSSLNCWLSAPGIWTLRYLGGAKDDGNAAMWRGSAVEAGLHRLLLGKPDTEALGAAQESFDGQCAGEVSEAIETEGKIIPGMVKRGMEWLASAKIGPLAATQLKVETRLDGVSVPVIGYLDFTFMEGPDVDCKTTKACPSKPRPDHVRQLSLYWQARERPQSLLYLTEKRFAYFPVPEDDLKAGIADLTRAAQSLERFLSYMPDANAAIRCMPMEKDSFMWSAAAETKLSAIMEAF